MNKDEAWEFLRTRQYIPCRDQFDWGGKPKRLVVMHGMVSPERHDMAEALGNYFRDPRNADGSKRSASTQWGTDDDSAVRYAEIYRGVYGTEGYGNTWAHHIEQADPGMQTPEEWFDPFSKKMLDEVSSKLCAALCIIDDIPIRWLEPGQLSQSPDNKGITSHFNMCQAFMKGNERNWHYDPKNFPAAYFIQQVQRHAGMSPEDNDMQPQDLFNACVPKENRANPNQATADEYLDAIAQKCDDRFGNGLFQAQGQSDRPGKKVSRWSITQIGDELLGNAAKGKLPTWKDWKERHINAGTAPPE